jgi:hypothetical protein
VLSRKQRATPAVPKIFDGEKEARLIALACSEPPKGYFRWTLRLLALPAGLGRVKVRLRYRRHILDIEVDRDLLRIRSRPFTANPITVAYRGHFRNVAPATLTNSISSNPKSSIATRTGTRVAMGAAPGGPQRRDDDSNPPAERSERGCRHVDKV